MEAREPGDIDENIDNFLNLMENVCDPLFAKNLNVPIGGLLIQIILINNKDHGSMKNVKHCEIVFTEN